MIKYKRRKKQEKEQEYLTQKQHRQLIEQEQKHERQLLALVQSQQRKEQILEEQEFAREHIRFCSCVHIWFRMRICMFKLCTNMDES